MALNYISIDNNFRKANNLSFNEYSLLFMIFHLQKNPESKVKDWCYMSRENMANEIGVSKQAIINIIDKLINSGFILKDEETKFLQTTKKFHSHFYTDGKESLPEPVKKVYPNDGKESLPYINNKGLDINNDNKEAWKTDFEIYLKELRSEYQKLINDPNYIRERETYHPFIDVKLSIEKACKDYWATKEGWEFKKKKKTSIINWRSTINKALSMQVNQVKKPFKQAETQPVIRGEQIYVPPKR